MCYILNSWIEEKQNAGNLPYTPLRANETNQIEPEHRLPVALHGLGLDHVPCPQDRPKPSPPDAVRLVPKPQIAPPSTECWSRITIERAFITTKWLDQKCFAASIPTLVSDITIFAGSIHFLLLQSQSLWYQVIGNSFCHSLAPIFHGYP